MNRQRTNLHNPSFLSIIVAMLVTVAVLLTGCREAYPVSTVPPTSATISVTMETSAITTDTTLATALTSTSSSVVSGTTTTTATSASSTTTITTPLSVSADPTATTQTHVAATVTTGQSVAAPSKVSTTTAAPTTTAPTTAATQIAAPAFRADGLTPSLWRANCNEYITLRPALYSAQAIARIPRGDTMVLLDWYGVYAKVSYYGMTGYVLANWIAPVQDANVGLTVVSFTDQYSYGQMSADMDALCAQYPSVCRRDSIGTSELGRDIPVLILGAESAAHHVLIQGAIHGLEHMTSWVMMAMADRAASTGAVPQDVCFHLIPMSNPDGVILSQTGFLTDAQRAIYASDLAAGYTKADQSAYTTQWKANGLGVDLNRNFDAGWASIQGHNAPSSKLYKGTAPFSAAESRALRDYTLAHSFDATISYHATGSLIYYEYGSAQPVNSLSFQLGQAVNAVSGYLLIDSDTVDGGGYKDWAMNALGIPSLTIEIGCDDTPLEYQELYNVLYRNLSVLDAVGEWVKQ